MLNASCLDVLRISYSTETVYGTDYVITTETGEGTFAYLASDITEESDRYDALSDAEKKNYSYTDGFCANMTPEYDRDLAISLAAIPGLRIHSDGSCMSVLSNEEYALIRAVADTLS